MVLFHLRSLGLLLDALYSPTLGFVTRWKETAMIFSTGMRRDVSVLG
jgi:hypothetical protein